jgi:signal transduction histidine kinase
MGRPFVTRLWPSCLPTAGPSGRGGRWAWLMLASAGAVVLTQAAMWDQRPVLAVGQGLVGLSFILTGAFMANDRDQVGNGRLLALTGVAWILGGIGSRDLGPLPLLGWLCAPLFVVTGAALILRYPGSALRSKRDRAFVISALGFLLPARGALAATTSPTQWGYGYDAPVWWPTVTEDPRVASVVSSANLVGSAVLVAVFLRLVTHRVRRLRAVDRTAVPPVAIASGAVGVATGTHFVVAVLPATPVLQDGAAILEALALLAVPVAFLVAAFRRRLACGAVADLVLQIAGPETTQTVQDALQRALKDPTVAVWFWVPSLGRFVDSSGRPGQPPQAPPGRFRRAVDARDGQPLAVVLMDASLEHSPALVDAALTACAMSMENARLHAELRTQLDQVGASRARIVEAGLAERSRLERDLHDGAQQRLLALAMGLASLEQRTTDPGSLAMLDQSRAELRRALQELRDLARGIHPALLAQAGLGPALEAVAERLPLPVQVRAPAQRWDSAVEATAYFVVCEALTNAVKHGAASRAHVRVEPADGELVVEVVDDGRGGADPGLGGGLAGLRDRVGAVGGQLAITSPAGSGTRIQARIPCA